MRGFVFLFVFAKCWSLPPAVGCEATQVGSHEEPVGGDRPVVKQAKDGGDDESTRTEDPPGRESPSAVSKKVLPFFGWHAQARGAGMRRPTQHMAALRLAMPPDDRSREKSSHLLGNSTSAWARRLRPGIFDRLSPGLQAVDCAGQTGRPRHLGHAMGLQVSA